MSDKKPSKESMEKASTAIQNFDYATGFNGIGTMMTSTQIQVLKIKIAKQIDAERARTIEEAAKVAEDTCICDVDITSQSKLCSEGRAIIAEKIRKLGDK